MIDNIYSNNPIQVWQETIEIEEYINKIDKTSFNGALEIAKMYSIGAKGKLEKQAHINKVERKKVRIEFN